MNRNIFNGIRQKALFILAGLLVTVSLAAQQKITVKGTITDETDLPLIGAGIQEKGSSNGTVTDIDGKFSIEVPSDGTLVFNYISYKTQEIAVNGKAVINVKLLPDNTVLDEVVVIGYGTAKRSDLTGSISSVASGALENFKTASVMEALGGQVAGVQITQADGTPGSGFDIKIRGLGTVNGDASPLYIVDGFEVSSLDYVSNSDIQSIDILKDASAAAIYGARAANGVVLVTTKSGREGKPQITYNGSASYRVISKEMELLDPYEFVGLQVELDDKYRENYFKEGVDELGDPLKYQKAEDYIGVPGINWQREAFRPTWSQNHEVSISGGSKDTKYSGSFSHYDENGIFTNSSYKKDVARLRINQKIFKWLTLDATVNYANTIKRGIGTSGSSGSLNVLASLLRGRPTGGLRNTDEEILTSLFDPLDVENDSFNQVNPILQTEAVSQKRLAEMWGANGSLTFKITKDLSFKTSATYNTTNKRDDSFFKEGSSQAYRSGGPYGETRFGKDVRWSNSNVFTFNKKIKKNHINALLGHEVSYRSSEFLLGQSKDFPFDNLGNSNLGIGATPSRVETSFNDKMLISFFLQGQYSYDDRYLLTATVRTDASTVFSQAHKWGVFPSFAAAWRIDKEKFMRNADWLSNLKLRVGWGTVGNDRIANYLSMDLYQMNKYGLGNKLVTVLNPKQLANQDLKWEGSMTANVGLDIGFADRVNITLDAFLKDTKDLLLAQNLAQVTGFKSQWQNAGKIRNQGIELNINSINFNKRHFSWKTDLNMSFIKNTLVSLQGDTQTMLAATNFQSNFRNYDYIAQVGQTLGNMYGYVFDGVYQYSDFDMTAGGNMVLKPGIPDISSHAGRATEPGMVKYKDMDNDGVITPKDRTIIGNGLPTWYGGMTNTFEIYGIDFSFMFQFSYGNDVYNATRMFTTQSQDERSNQLKEVADRWRPDHASNAVPSARGYVKNELYSRFVEDGSFLRLKNVTLGYTLPNKWTRKAHISRLRIYATAQNLFCVTKYSGFDPEVNMRDSPLMPGFDWGAYPKARTFTFGLELQFN